MNTPYSNSSCRKPPEAPSGRLHEAVRLLSAVGTVLWVVATIACSREEKAAQTPSPTAPWPAPAAPVEPTAAPEEREKVTYSIRPGSTVRMSLPAKEARPEGTFRVVRGTLQLDLLDLAQSDGTLEIDLGSVLMQANKDHLERQYTEEARSWMNLGASRPEAAIERARWARFALTGIEGLSHAAPHLGRRLAAESLDANRDPELPPGERRRVSLTAVGELEANGIRVQRKAAVQLDFHYSAPATLGFPPSRVTLSTIKPMTLALSDHDIQPRDAHGRLVSAQLDLLGRLVGRHAQVTFQLIATPPESVTAQP